MPSSMQQEIERVAAAAGQREHCVAAAHLQDLQGGTRMLTCSFNWREETR